jgi:hypothetical protein
MVGGPNPGITGEAIRKALGPEEHGRDEDRAALDEAELRELERSEYYPEEPAAVQPGTNAPWSLLDRLFRRKGG